MQEQLVERVAEAMYANSSPAIWWDWKDAPEETKRFWTEMAEIAVRTFREVEQSP